MLFAKCNSYPIVRFPGREGKTPLAPLRTTLSGRTCMARPSNVQVVRHLDHNTPHRLRSEKLLIECNYEGVAQTNESGEDGALHVSDV